MNKYYFTLIHNEADTPIRIENIIHLALVTIPLTDYVVTVIYTEQVDSSLVSNDLDTLMELEVSAVIKQHLRDLYPKLNHHVLEAKS